MDNLNIMEFTPQQKQQYVTRYVKIAEKLSVHDSMLNFSELWDAVQPLISEIKKHKELLKHITETEFFLLIEGGFRKLSQKNTDGGNYKLTDRITATEIQEEAEKFIKFLEGIPYEYLYYFRVPIEFPDGLAEIKITDDVSLLKPLKCYGDAFLVPLPSPSSLALALFAGKGNYRVREEDVFCEIRVRGYGDRAQAEASTVFKQFLYLAEASGLLHSLKWKRQPNVKYDINVYKRPAVDGNTLTDFTLPADIAAYISGLTLDDNRFKDFVPRKKNPSSRSLLDHYDDTREAYFEREFRKGCNRFIELHNASKKDHRSHIVAAIEWGFDGEANANETMGFIQVCIGLEALLGDKNAGGQRSLTEKLADRCAYLLGNTPDFRQTLRKDFEKIYELRSRLVHGVWLTVKDEHRATVSQAGDLLKRLVYKELWLSQQND